MATRREPEPVIDPKEPVPAGGVQAYVVEDVRHGEFVEFVVRLRTANGSHSFLCACYTIEKARAVCDLVNAAEAAAADPIVVVEEDKEKYLVELLSNANRLLNAVYKVREVGP